MTAGLESITFTGEPARTCPEPGNSDATKPKANAFVRDFITVKPLAPLLYTQAPES